MGAKIVEKHFTLNKKLKGPDHSSSLEPDELTKMIKAIRNIEISLGHGKKIPSISEKKNITIARKSIVAKKEILKGQLFTLKNFSSQKTL